MTKIDSGKDNKHGNATIHAGGREYPNCGRNFTVIKTRDGGKTMLGRF
jgi:hypothetical protein